MPRLFWRAGSLHSQGMCWLATDLSLGNIHGWTVMEGGLSGKCP